TWKPGRSCSRTIPAIVAILGPRWPTTGTDRSPAGPGEVRDRAIGFSLEHPLICRTRIFWKVSHEQPPNPATADDGTCLQHRCGQRKKERNCGREVYVLSGAIHEKKRCDRR